MLLTELYLNRIKKLAGLTKTPNVTLIKEATDLYTNSGKRMKFDMNIMKQAIVGGMVVGMVFQSNNSKYKMPIWKMRVVQPVAMGFDKNGELVVRGIHVEGQSEKKAIQTGIRSAEAKNEWRLFKASNIKSMFFTGRLFNKVSLPGYNPNDSAMSNVIASFDPNKAMEYQKQLDAFKNNPEAPIKKPLVLKEPKKPLPKPEVPATEKPKPVNPEDIKRKENIRKLKDKISKLNNLL